MYKFTYAALHVYRLTKLERLAGEGCPSENICLPIKNWNNVPEEQDDLENVASIVSWKLQKKR